MGGTTKVTFRNAYDLIKEIKLRAYHTLNLRNVFTKYWQMTSVKERFYVVKPKS